MASWEAQPALATTSVFQPGGIECTTLTRDASAPRPLRIRTPIMAGEYPVILFCHGFCLSNCSYSDLLDHIASHGYIVVAPQFGMISEQLRLSQLPEIKCAGEVADWIAEKLQSLLPAKVIANLDKFIMAGHSRGGKTAFAVALGYAKTKLNISALVGVDPVAGSSQQRETSPCILNGQAGSFKLSMPVAIIGTGLGPQNAIPCIPLACAPKGVNHVNFFKHSNPPLAYFVAKEYGHMDMLNDEVQVIDKIKCCLCKNGTGPKDCMRRTVGGLVVAFLRAQLDLDPRDLYAIVDNPSLAPAMLDPAKYIKAP